MTEIVSWGLLYYAFPVLAPRISADTGWSSMAVTSAFSAALVVSALVGVPVGRVIDRRGPRLVMTVGSVLGVLALVVIGTAGSLPVFVAGWVLAGAAMAGVLYPPAFAAVTGWFDARRLGALATLTLVAGLASTVFGTALMIASAWTRACAEQPLLPPRGVHSRG
ncbi:MFS transporter [Knoellia remsis]|uniref:MFS transporter n=1 Tax=Knoellia remsis TaxID=407159 RepID=UPI001C46C6C6|nr:MFS transporter [Knoellia remsis]